jgi:uncharacterized membrane protein
LHRILGGRFKRIIVKGKELGIVVPKHLLRIVYDLVYLVIGVVEIIVMCSEVLEELLRTFQRLVAGLFGL